MLPFIVAGLVLSRVASYAEAAADRVSEVQLSGGVRRFSFPPPMEMTRAEMYVWAAQASPQAVLVLCPGLNGDGESLIRQQAWQMFAQANHLALCATSFVSPEAEVRAQRGYLHAARGSGDLLLRSIRLGFGRDLPILIYGFSCGARFAISVADWQPARVLVWCAYSACWWEEPQFSSRFLPPGIVACGENDAVNYGTSTTLFAKGRASGLPWTWVSLAHTGHVWSEPLNQFVRAYFAVILRNRLTASNHPFNTKSTPSSATGTWRDVDTKLALSQGQVLSQPMLASWLPEASLDALWSSVHCP